MRRGLALAATLTLLAALTGCSPVSSPAPSATSVQAVGIATDVRIYPDHMRYVFADGSVHEVPLSYRQVGDGGFGLVVIGSNDGGNFVASFPTQAGLPVDCYRENAVGIERGAYIETQGVLWAKAPSFTSPVQPKVGSAYPAGTRFCFNERGLITSVIGF